MQISKIRASRKRLQRESSVKPLDKERVRRYAKDVADNAKARVNQVPLLFFQEFPFFFLAFEAF